MEIYMETKPIMSSVFKDIYTSDKLNKHKNSGMAATSYLVGHDMAGHEGHQPINPNLM